MVYPLPCVEQEVVLFFPLLAVSVPFLIASSVHEVVVYQRENCKERQRLLGQRGSIMPNLPTSIGTPLTSVKCAKFTNASHATKDDCDIIASQFSPYAKKLPDRIMEHLATLADDFGGFPVSRLTHSLQCATRARLDGRDEEYVVCALLHDIGDALGTYNHPDIAAAILKPFVSEENHWMIQYHEVIQGYYFFHHYGLDRNRRDAFKDHPHYGRTVEFVDKYDVTAFDPAYEAHPLSSFEPLVRSIFHSPKNAAYNYRNK